MEILQVLAKHRKWNNSFLLVSCLKLDFLARRKMSEVRCAGVRPRRKHYGRHYHASASGKSRGRHIWIGDHD